MSTDSSSNGYGSDSKAKELEEVNRNLSAQIGEYNKLVMRLHEDDGKVSEEVVRRF